LVSIKSGPNCINDTQVTGMTTAIVPAVSKVDAATKVKLPRSHGADVIGLTTDDRTTNNKKPQFFETA